MTLSLSLPGVEVRFTTRAEGNLREPGNVEALRAAYGLDALVFGRQVHGVAIRDAREAVEADGCVTRERLVGCGALGADCVPVVLVGDGAVSVVHAGWRGLAAGVVEAGVAALGGDVRAAVIGPHARVCCYEVGPEVHAAFGLPPRRANIDLAAVVRGRLGDVTTDVGLCTMCDGRFFSHRADGGDTGRQAGVAWLS